MSTLERAIEIAARAHGGQTDKAGKCYILHPLRVMLHVDTVDEQIVAVLHDTLEDTPVTADMLRTEGFSEEILVALDALTKRDGETRIQAAYRAAANPLARRVKLADNADNSDLSRIPKPTEADYARLAEYEKVRAILVAASGDAPLQQPAELSR